MQFDVVSDLHVEHWSDFPYDWKRHKKSDNVIIAGDVADDVHTTVDQLKTACDVYERVVYISGNHEATRYYHNLFLVGPLISHMMQGHSNFYNLDMEDVVIDECNLAIVGKTGWWDFRIREPEISFKLAMYHFDTTWCALKNKKLVVNNILNAAHSNFLKMRDAVDAHKRAGRAICLVTHTVPHKELLSVNYPNDTFSSSYYGNSLIQSLFYEPTVKYAIFGHSHERTVRVVDNTVCVNNARGRPQDYNRVQYEPYAIVMGEKN